MNFRSCKISELPDDLQTLVLDFVEGSLGEWGLERFKNHEFRLRHLPVSAFPRVRMWTDYRDRAYAEAMVGQQLPPILVCGDCWLDGRNRVWAARQGGRDTVDCIDLAEVGVRVRNHVLGRLRWKQPHFRSGFLATCAQELEDPHKPAQQPEKVRRLERIADAAIAPEIRDIPAGPRRTVVEQIQRKVRDARFRKNILSAYGHRCAASDIQLDLLDAAHIVPVEHERGTDETKNGLCLSALHHRAFDHGLLGIKRNYTIVFNEEHFTKLRAIGWEGGERAFRDGCRDAINLPARREFYPDPDYLVFGQVLRGWNARHLS